MKFNKLYIDKYKMSEIGIELVDDEIVDFEDILIEHKRSY